MQTNSDRNKLENIACTYFFSWSSVVLGALIALGLGFLLDLFGMGIGLSAYTNSTEGATKLAIGGFLGLIIGAIATMFTAGFAAGYFAGPHCGKKNYGVVYGFAAWCLSLLLIAMASPNITNYSYSKNNLSGAGTNEVAMTARNVTTNIHPATDSSDTRAEKNVRAAGILSLSLFAIFFIGAFSASIGGHAGLSSWNKRNDLNNY